MGCTRRWRNQNRSLIQVDQPTGREKVESMLRGGCARGGNKTKEDDELTHWTVGMRGNIHVGLCNLSCN